MIYKTSFFRVSLLIIAGAASVFSFAPYRLSYLMLPCLAALIVLIQRQEKRAFFSAWLWAVAAYSANLYWIYYSLHDVAGLNVFLTIPLVFLLPIILAVFPAFALSLTLRLTPNKNMATNWHEISRWLIVFPACWTLSEWLRSWLFTGLSWVEVGYSQIIESPLAGFAPLIGIHGVSLVLAFFAGLLALIVQVGFKRFYLSRKIKIWLAFVGVFLITFGGWSKSHNWTTPIGGKIKVALAQGNIPQKLKWSESAFDSTLQLYAKQIVSTKADLMILPEAALPRFLNELPNDYIEYLRQNAEYKQMYLAIGVPIRQDNLQLNAVLNINSKNQEYYAKQHLVPFGEYIPLPIFSRWLYELMNMPMSSFNADAAHDDVLHMAGQKIAFNVCYEDGFSYDVLRLARSSTMLANVSNLAWFGKSNAIFQQLQHSQARALETGRYMLRSTNTGVTAIIDQKGRIKAQAPANIDLVLIGQAQGYQAWTPFMYFGNYLVVILSIFLAIFGYVDNKYLSDKK